MILWLVSVLLLGLVVCALNEAWSESQREKPRSMR